MNKHCKNAAALRRGAKRYFDSISRTEPVEGSQYNAVRTVWLEPPTLEGLCLCLEISPLLWSAFLDGSKGEAFREAALWAELVISQFLSLELLVKAKGTDGAKLLWQQSGSRLWSTQETELTQDKKPDTSAIDLEGKERVLRQMFHEK